MAVLALAGIGAAAGIGVGAAAGLTTAASLLTAASIGMSVGTMAGNLLFPPKQPNVNQEGSRITDLTVDSSTYGAIVPMGVGTVRISGNVIWALDIQETKHVATQRAQGGKGGGRKGGGTVTQTTYTYAGTWAIAFCKGPVDRILKIWANADLIYDATSSSVMRKEGLTFRFYPGDEAQLPDSVMETHLGTGNVPAYRGICYIVIDNLPLAAYGNRLPNIQVEVAFVTSDNLPIYRLSNGVSLTKFGQEKAYSIAINPLSLVGYTLGTTPNNGLIEFSLDDLSVRSEHYFTEIIGASPLDTANTNLIYMTMGGDDHLWVGFDEDLYRINPTSWQLISHITLAAVSPYNGTCGAMAPMAIISTSSLQGFLLVQDRITRNIHLIDAQNAYELEVLTPTSGSGSLFGGGCFAVSTGQVGVGYGEGWALSVKDDDTIHGATLYIDLIQVGQKVSVGLLGASISTTAGVRNVVEIAATDFDATTSGWHSSYVAAAGIVYDETDDTAICIANLLTSGDQPRAWIFKVDKDAGVVWKTDLHTEAGVNGFSGRLQLSKISGTDLSIAFGQKTVTISAADGSVLTTQDWSSAMGSDKAQQYPQAYEQTSNQIIYADSTARLWKILIGRADYSTATVAEMCAKIMDEAAIPSADYDVTDIASIGITGYVMSQRTSAREAMRPLLDLFAIDVVERDDVLVFQQRGGASVATITEDEMLRGDGASSDNSGLPWSETRRSERELPFRVTLTYTDPNQDFQTNTQAATRVRNPTATTRSDQQEDVAIALVMDADTAAQRAEIMLYERWVSRRSLAFNLPPKFAYLDPADPVTVQLNNGLSLRMRLGSLTLGSNYALQVAAIAEDEGQWTSEAAGETSSGIQTREVFRNEPSRVLILNTPLLRDIDNLSNIGLRLYWGVAPYRDTTSWHGAQLQLSDDGAAWSAIDVAVNGVPYGYLEAALPDGNDTYSTQFDQEITVQMIYGGDSLETVTLLQMANGYNAAAVIKANGEVEVIQFLTVTHISGDRYTLTSLNRGCRGTDTMANDHAPGEMIVFINTDTIFPTQLPTTAAEKTIFARAVSSGQLPMQAISSPFLIEPRDQMPYAPVQVTATLSGSDIDISWVRRSRLDGGLKDGTGDVPNYEGQEVYEVDVYDDTGTTVLRTLTVTDATTVTYTHANIVSDFGSPIPTQLYLRVVQLSYTWGRGFSRLDLVEVV